MVVTNDGDLSRDHHIVTNGDIRHDLEVRTNPDSSSNGESARSRDPEARANKGLLTDLQAPHALGARDTQAEAPYGLD
jgi:hypothetical protein